jgi:hypothetical protein
MTVDRKLVAKGRGEPLAGLTYQAKVHLGLVQKHAEPLSKAGWSAEDTEALAAAIPALETDAAQRVEAASNARQATRDKRRGLARGKSFVKRLRNAVPKALRSNSFPGITRESFALGKKLDRSVPRLALYLNNITTHVVRMDEALKTYFGGKSAAAELSEIRKMIDSTSTVQELARVALPAETAAVYEAKGRVLVMIEDINRLGKNAFEDAPEVARQFNKAILARAKRQQAGEEEVPPEPGPKSSQALKPAMEEDPTIEEVTIVEESAPEQQVAP